jgi:hypothetical protein
MFFQNTTIKLNLEIDGHYLHLKDSSTNIIVETLNIKKIYKCAVRHNMVPFSTDPQDMSWCGIAFPYGSRESLDFLNVR